MIILGIESSCDETAAALVADGTKILSSEVASQEDIHSLYGGVVPELASRQHLEVIVPIFKRCLQKAGIKISAVNAVAATTAPGLSGSLLVGDNFGRAVALALEVPFVPVNHLEAHLAANFFPQLPEFPALGLVVSGGHSSLFLLSGPNDFQVLGETRDDAAGETFDKIARVLSLCYPGGPPLERLAATAESAIRFPLPGVKNSYDFSFSGLKTAVVYYLKEHPEADKAAVAAGFQNSVVEGLIRKLEYARNRHKVRSILTGGGVLANNFLRSKLKIWAEEKGIGLRIPSVAFSLDNAGMVAVRAFYLL
ncbi:MAG: tRNA (adenosine(37)-N6)-threonylcarbamoyltransferase complex transferase subunit TsaD [Candidatus Omnitrophota bacterium]